MRRTAATISFVVHLPVKGVGLLPVPSTHRLLLDTRGTSLYWLGKVLVSRYLASRTGYWKEPCTFHLLSTTNLFPRLYVQPCRHRAVKTGTVQEGEGEQHGPLHPYIKWRQNKHRNYVATVSEARSSQAQLTRRQTVGNISSRRRVAAPSHH